MPGKPYVVVTRKLPDSVETRMMELFRVKLNLEDVAVESFVVTPERAAGRGSVRGSSISPR